MELKDLLTFILVLVLSVSGSDMESDSMNKPTHAPPTTMEPTTMEPTTMEPTTTNPTPKTPASECATDAVPQLNAGDPVTDPDNCSNFYVCNSTGGYYPDPIPCPSGECFDHTARMCTMVQTACTGCEPSIPVSKCKSECDKQYDQIADPHDCGEHYICLKGEDKEWILYPQHCPPERPFFDGYDCVTEKTQCCKCQPPTCNTDDGGITLVDPQDCQSYYLCVDFGQSSSQITVAVHVTCPDTLYFNKDTGKCDNKECPPNDCDSGVDVGKTTPISSSSKATTTSSSSSSTATTTPSSGSSTETATLSSGTSTTKTTTTTPGCTDLSGFTCPPGNRGYYARCSFCHSSYFDCTGPDAPTQKSCSMELVFNTNPKYPKCILPEKCPFNP